MRWTDTGEAKKLIDIMPARPAKAAKCGPPFVIHAPAWQLPSMPTISRPLCGGLASGSIWLRLELEDIISAP